MPKRLAAIDTFAVIGIPTGLLAAPMIPALNDFELECILEAATVGAKVEVSLLKTMRFSAMRTVRNIRIRRDRLERLQLVPLHIEPNIHGFPYRRAVHEHL